MELLELPNKKLREDANKMRPGSFRISARRFLTNKGNVGASLKFIKFAIVFMSSLTHSYRFRFLDSTSSADRSILSICLSLADAIATKIEQKVITASIVSFVIPGCEFEYSPCRFSFWVFPCGCQRQKERVHKISHIMWPLLFFVFAANADCSLVCARKDKWNK